MGSPVEAEWWCVSFYLGRQLHPENQNVMEREQMRWRYAIDRGEGADAGGQSTATLKWEVAQLTRIARFERERYVRGTFKCLLERVSRPTRRFGLGVAPQRTSVGQVAEGMPWWCVGCRIYACQPTFAALKCQRRDRPGRKPESVSFDAYLGR